MFEYIIVNVSMKSSLSIAFSGILLFLASISHGQTYSFSSEELANYKLHGPLFWVQPEGTYKGAVPCDDCPGIEITLEFNENNTVKKSMRYIQKNSSNKKFSGTWVVEPGNIVRITLNGSNVREYYKAQAGGHLIALNENKKKIEDRSGQFNIFNPD